MLFVLLALLFTAGHSSTVPPPAYVNRAVNCNFRAILTSDTCNQFSMKTDPSIGEMCKCLDTVNSNKRSCDMGFGSMQDFMDKKCVECDMEAIMEPLGLQCAEPQTTRLTCLCLNKVPEEERSCLMKDRPLEDIIEELDCSKFSDYVLGKQGEKKCPAGTSPLTAGPTACASALAALNVPVSDIIPGTNVCYKDGHGNGKNNGLNGSGAYYICEINSAIGQSGSGSGSGQGMGSGSGQGTCSHMETCLQEQAPDKDTICRCMREVVHMNGGVEPPCLFEDAPDGMKFETFCPAALELKDGDECDSGAGFVFSGECCATDKLVWNSDYSLPVKCCQVTIPPNDPKCENQDTELPEEKKPSIDTCEKPQNVLSGNDASGCSKTGNYLAVCEPCLHSTQCNSNSHCCPFLKRCINIRGRGEKKYWCDQDRVCKPLCSESSYRNPDYPYSCSSKCSGWNPCEWTQCMQNISDQRESLLASLFELLLKE